MSRALSHNDEYLYLTAISLDPDLANPRNTSGLTFKWFCAQPPTPPPTDWSGIGTIDCMGAPLSAVSEGNVMLDMNTFTAGMTYEFTVHISDNNRSAQSTQKVQIIQKTSLHIVIR